MSPLDPICIVAIIDLPTLRRCILAGPFATADVARDWVVDVRAVIREVGLPMPPIRLEQLHEPRSVITHVASFKRP